MVLGGEVFGRKLGHEGIALMSRISALIKGTSESSCTLFIAPCEDTMRKAGSLQPGTGPRQNPAMLAHPDLTSSLWNCEQ